MEDRKLESQRSGVGATVVAPIQSASDDSDSNMQEDDDHLDETDENECEENDDEGLNTDDSTAPYPIPVGITIAYNREPEEGSKSTIKLRNRKSKKNEDPTTKRRRQEGGTSNYRTRSSASPHNNTTHLRGGYKKPVASFTLFLEGTALYIICLVLPTLLGLIINFYDDVSLLDWKRDSAAIVKGRIRALRHNFQTSVDNVCSYYDVDTGEYYFDEPSNDTSDLFHSDDGIRQTVSKMLQRAFQVVYTPLANFLIRVLTCGFHKSGLCERVSEQLLREAEQEFNHFVVSKDTAYWVQDGYIILVCSMVLAAFRIWIVQTTVPLEDSRTVEALVRCKSVHLLSSDYANTMTPVSTPMVFRKRTRTRVITGAENNDALTPFLTPDLTANAIATNRHIQQQPFERSHSQDIGMRWDETERDDDNNLSTGPFMSSLTPENTTILINSFPQSRTSSILDDSETDDDDIIHASMQQQSQILSGAVASSLEAIQSNQSDSILEPASPTPQRHIVDEKWNLSGSFSENSISGLQPLRTRVNAAPRYATALFRLLWSTISSVLALYYFRKSNFWPWYVGGSGATANCWDLSGGLSVGGMDSDFDHFNTVLKRYFLGQASYHWHSGAFHILSMLYLLLHPSTKVAHTIAVDDEFEAPEEVVDETRHSKIPNSTPTSVAAPPESHHTAMKLLFGTSSTAYIRSLAQHVLALALIASAYIFSSLRRLGVIGMFAFDVSNWFLHLLQVCMNAPMDSRLKYSKVIFCIYWLGVVPSFVITRFLIWPSLWYSATFESQRWLIQLEKTLWIGAATTLRWIFHVWMFLIQLLNMVYFYRLLYHPHLINILKKQTCKPTDTK